MIAGFVGNFLGMCNLIVKGVLGVIFMMWLRWTLPRLRIDQVYDDLPEILRAVGLDHAGRHDGFDVRSCAAGYSRQPANTTAVSERQPPH